MKHQEPQRLSEFPSRLRNPLNDQPFAYRPNADGSVFLGLEGDPEILAEAFHGLTGDGTESKIAPFVWKLPTVEPQR